MRITETNGTWGPLIALPGGDQFTSVSCPDPTDCTAVGIGIDANLRPTPMYEAETNGSWGPITDIYGSSPDFNGGVSSGRCARPRGSAPVGGRQHAPEA